MISKLFAIRDDAAVAFMSPFVERNNDTAMRGFKEAILSDAYGKFCKADFTLYALGEFDSKDASISLFDVPDYICKGSDFDVSN